MRHSYSRILIAVAVERMISLALGERVCIMPFVTFKAY